MKLKENLILEAERECSGKADFFSYLESEAIQTLIDITSDKFKDYVDYFNRPANLEDETEETMSVLVARAKRELRQEHSLPEQPNSPKKSSSNLSLLI